MYGVACIWRLDHLRARDPYSILILVSLALLCYGQQVQGFILLLVYTYPFFPSSISHCRMSFLLGDSYERRLQ